MRKSDAASEQALARLQKVGVDQLTLPEKVLATIWEVEAEVNNGGFDQFFFNSTGAMAAFAPEAFRIIGANAMAKLAEQANAVFGPDGPPIDRDERQDRLSELDDDATDALSELDSQFYEYPDDLDALLDAYAEREGLI